MTVLGEIMTILGLAKEIKFVKKTLKELYMSKETLRNHVKHYSDDEFERLEPVKYKIHKEEFLRLNYLETIYEQRLDELNNKYGAIDL